MTLTKMMTSLTQTTYTEPTIRNQFSVPLIHMFTWVWSGLWQDTSSHVLTDSTSLCIFMLFCFELEQLLVEETNWYYDQCLLTLEEGQCQLRDVTVQELYLFLLCRWGTNIGMGHAERLLVHIRTVLRGLLQKHF